MYFAVQIGTSAVLGLSVGVAVLNDGWRGVRIASVLCDVDEYVRGVSSARARPGPRPTPCRTTLYS